MRVSSGLLSLSLSRQSSEIDRTSPKRRTRRRRSAPHAGNYTTLLVALASIISSSQASSAPWQSSRTASIIDEERYGDLPPHIFAPNGVLFPLQKIMEATTSGQLPCANSILALSCTDSIVVLSTTVDSPYIPCSEATIDGSTPLRLPPQDPFDFGACIRASSSIIAFCAGDPRHSQIQLRKVLALATRDRSLGMARSAARLARQLADLNQLASQEPNDQGRMLASQCLILDTTGSTFWRVDPTGCLYQCNSAAIGKNSQKLQDLLSVRLPQESLEPKDALALLRDVMTASIEQQRMSSKTEFSKGSSLSLCAWIFRGNEIEFYTNEQIKTLQIPS